MSAQLDNLPSFRAMRVEDLEAVLAIENDVYPYPWTRGNFVDSLTAGYGCHVMQCAGEIAGYGVLMIAAGEAHLLNLSVARRWQRQGCGRALLEHFVELARSGHAAGMYLEVRPSNAAARALYRAAGFREIALRRGYYPADQGREDAIVLELAL